MRLVHEFAWQLPLFISQIDPVTGMVINLTLVKEALQVSKSASDSGRDWLWAAMPAFYCMGGTGYVQQCLSVTACWLCVLQQPKASVCLTSPTQTAVTEPLDHKNLDKDVPYFQHHIR